MNGAVILLVTWLVSGVSPSNYQVPFSSMATCEEAKTKVLAEREKLVAAEADYVADVKKRGVIQIPKSVTVSAVCTAE